MPFRGGNLAKLEVWLEWGGRAVTNVLAPSRLTVSSLGLGETK